MSPDMATGTVSPQSVTDPSVAAMLLTFFTISDIHICDKESPARCIDYAYQYPNPSIPVYGPVGNSSAYSGIILYTTQVLDAAVQTINAVHQVTPFDFGISLGDAADNTQYNELRWYIDVLDGKMIHPSSGAHRGAHDIDYQKPYPGGRARQVDPVVSVHRQPRSVLDGLCPADRLHPKDPRRTQRPQHGYGKRITPS